MKQKAYMVQERIFFSVEKLQQYLLDLVQEWKEHGCQGTMKFPKVKIGIYEVIANQGRWVPVFIEDKTGQIFMKEDLMINSPL